MKFKIGDRVKVIKEPPFVTVYPNNVWKMHPRSSSEEFSDFGNDLVIKNMWGRADLTHLLGEEGVIDYYQWNIFEHGRTTEPRAGWWNIKFDNDIAVPRGLMGFSDDEIELI